MGTVLNFAIRSPRPYRLCQIIKKAGYGKVVSSDHNTIVNHLRIHFSSGLRLIIKPRYLAVWHDEKPHLNVECLHDDELEPLLQKEE